MRAVILAGGLGTRLREETEFRPKPMVEIGDKPILWHIMKNLSSHEISDFVVALGYKGDMIRDFFVNYELRTQDSVVKLGQDAGHVIHDHVAAEEWSVTLADTGPKTMTGGRIYRLKKYLNSERFLCTYGDGLSNIDIASLIKFHVSHGKIATVTAALLPSRFGSLRIGTSGQVENFEEKPSGDSWVNAGFFIFEPDIFDYLDAECILERGPLESLAAAGQLMAFKHTGAWKPMDTLRDSQELIEIWNSGNAFWKNW
jgi:glucose-1-phosphate cytidylyltransferase